MDFLLHVLDRSWVHFYSAQWMGLVFVIGWLLIKKYTSVGRYQNIITALLFVWAMTTLREAYDVMKGGRIEKSIIDYIVWFVSLGFAGWWMSKAKKWLVKKGIWERLELQ